MNSNKRNSPGEQGPESDAVSILEQFGEKLRLLSKQVYKLRLRAIEIAGDAGRLLTDDLKTVQLLMKGDRLDRELDRIRAILIETVGPELELCQSDPALQSALDDQRRNIDAAVERIMREGINRQLVRSDEWTIRGILMKASIYQCGDVYYVELITGQHILYSDDMSFTEATQYMGRVQSALYTFNGKGTVQGCLFLNDIPFKER